jgi:hypothetical protein
VGSGRRKKKLCGSLPIKNIGTSGVSSVFSPDDKISVQVVFKKPEIGGPKPARRLERSFYSSEKTDKMFRKGGSNPWKNASKPLERRVKLLEKLTKCIGRTGQPFGRTGSKCWKNGVNFRKKRLIFRV